MELLLEAKVDINYFDPAGDVGTALTHACQEGRLDAVVLLLGESIFVFYPSKIPLLFSPSPLPLLYFCLSPLSFCPMYLPTCRWIILPSHLYLSVWMSVSISVYLPIC